MLTTRRRIPGLARTERAFTAIELLLVVAILIVLMAILAPAFRGAGKQATSSRCQSNLHQISLALSKRQSDASTFTTGISGTHGFFPTDQEWPAIPYGTVQEGGIFACPAIGEAISAADKPSPEMVLKGLVYYCRNRGFSINLSDPGVQGYGHQHVAVIQGVDAQGRYIDFAVEDVDPPVPSTLNQGDDGAVHITLDTFPAEATLTDCGCVEHNCILYNGKPLFPKQAGEPDSWTDPASIGMDGYYGYTGTRSKLGQKTPISAMRCDYGINKDGYQIRPGESKAVILDFDQNCATYDAPDFADKLNIVAQRHAGTINVLRAGGSVANMTPTALDPRLDQARGLSLGATWWKP
ncbi:MAG: type II secretion system protein [Planctomycetota bacterium]|nr:type II secretion system protein [Planctomycetota bacterium]